MECSQCGKPYRIVNQKYKLCALCNHKRLNKDKPKKAYQFKRTPIKYKRKKTGEGELFGKLWSSRPHFCVNCKGYLGEEAKAQFFAHTKAGKYKDIRLNPDMIELHCYPCHRAKDHGTRAQYDARKGINKNKFVGNEI